jgi:hypothetical protein
MDWLGAAEEAEFGSEIGPAEAPSASWRLGASMCVAVMVTAAAFAAPAYMSGLDPLTLEATPEQGLMAQITAQLAFRDGSLLIEPAAGPVEDDQLAACRALLADEPRGESDR